MLRYGHEPMSGTADYLLVIGEAEALRWIVAQERMAFAAGRAQQASNLRVGDGLLLYTSRGAFHNPTRDRGRVVGVATVTSPVTSLDKPVEIAGRAFVAGCSLRVERLAAWSEGVEIAPLVPRLEMFPDPSSWPIRLRQTLVPLPAADAALLRDRIDKVASAGREAVHTYPG